jgi:hypothetical protein
MKTTILAYVIALGGVAMIVVGLWGLYVLIKERVAELRLRDYVPAIQTIAVGLVLIGLARALQLLLLVFAAAPLVRKSDWLSCVPHGIFNGPDLELAHISQPLLDLGLGRGNDSF